MPSIPVVIPLIVAAFLAGAGAVLGRRALDLIGIATSTAVLAINIHLVLASAKAPIVYWFGGWQPDPRSHFPVGICFMIDPFGAGLAALVSLLVLVAFIFSWRYFNAVRSLYHALLLVFLASMCGFCLTGDLFNLFVWFELMTAVAVALCGYESGESQPLQGALNFAVTNTIGAFLTFIGLAFVYAYTGALNMAEVGSTLSRNPPGGPFVAFAFLLVVAGLLVKSAAFPFHFWLADAHAVAPTPICILFSGVMVELGIYGIAHIYWLVFAGSSAPLAQNVRTVFLLIGSITAILGALFCYGQRHLKRLLAFSTISHVGLMFLGFALLDPRALSGAAIYVVGHGLVKASLFIGAGILLHRFSSMDEYDLGHWGSEIKPIGVMMLVGAWGLAGLPPFATYFGEDSIDRAATLQHLDWLSIISIFAEAVTAAAVLRFTARVFFGLGRGLAISSEGAPHIPMERETRGVHVRTPVFMWLPMAVLLVLAMVIGFPLRGNVDHFAAQCENPSVYRIAVLQESAPAVDANAPTAAQAASQGRREAHPPSTGWTRIVVFLGMIGLAALGVFPRPRQHFVSRSMRTVIATPLSRLRLFQSGRVADYVAWLALGIAAYAAFLVLPH